jgi:hypothetical protein
MKITFELWLAIAFVGCLAIGVAVLPADGSGAFTSWMDLKTHSPEDAWVQRMQARAGHFYDVESVFRGMRVMSEAQQQFAPAPGKIGAPDVRFGSDVPQTFRVTFTRALSEERAAQHEWTGHGKVGILVVLDTAIRVNGIELERMRGSWNGTYTRVIPPGPATGDRCVTVVTIPSGDPWSRMLEGRPIGPMHPLLDACGFYDAFGAPGAEIARELVSAKYGFARGYFPLSPPDTTKHPVEYSWLGRGTQLGRCLAGADTMCVQMWLGSSEDQRGFSTVPGRGDWYGITAIRAPWRSIRMLTQLSRLAIAVGPQRFEKIWTSPKTIEAAYFDETGETLPSFIRSNMAAEVGSYRAGPSTPLISTTITLFAIAATLAAALRFSPRPTVA